jgi:phosphohistidine phosphatase
MRRLILFRHARAEARAPTGGDADRPLDAVGRAEAVLAGRWLAAGDFACDVVLVSASARTRQTWDCVENLLPRPRLAVLDSLYDAMPEDILDEIESAGRDVASVMVIAHNPGLQEVAVGLLSQNPAAAEGAEMLAAGFPTAGVAVLDMRDPKGAALEALFNPGRPGTSFVQGWDDEPRGPP